MLLSPTFTQIKFLRIILESFFFIFYESKGEKYRVIELPTKKLKHTVIVLCDTSSLVTVEFGRYDVYFRC